MPLYDYRCRECDHEFEVLQNASEAALTECPECGLETLKKLASAPSFTFKGSGWYKDLYGAPSPGASKPDASKSDTSKTPSSGASASDGKNKEAATKSASKSTSKTTTASAD